MACGTSTLSEEQGVSLDPFVREYCELVDDLVRDGELDGEREALPLQRRPRARRPRGLVVQLRLAQRVGLRVRRRAENG